jgi:hypothetical protein
LLVFIPSVWNALTPSQILEGLATIVLGVSCFFWLIDSPALSSKWLNTDEIRFLEIQKLIKDGGRGSAADESRVRWNDLKLVLKDWRLYLQSWIMLCAVACSYGTFICDLMQMLSDSFNKVQSSPCQPSQKEWASATQTHS